MRGLRSIGRAPVVPGALLVALGLAPPAARTAGGAVWRGDELRGTIVPDVVLHDGAPVRAQEVYDFKFPCGDDDQEALWRAYPDGRYQDEVYRKALGVTPVRVDPKHGVVRP